MGKVEMTYYDEEVLVLNCMSVDSDINYKDYIYNQNIILPNYIDEEKGKVYFKINKNETSLKNIINNKKIAFNKIDIITRALIKLFTYFENGNMNFHSLSFDDFVVNENDLSQVRLRLSRKINSNKYKGEISIPENCYKGASVANNNVYLFGKVFSSLLLSNTYTEDISEERYKLYNLCLIRNDVPSQLHKFIYKTNSLYAEDRYENMTQLSDSYEKIMEYVSKTKDTFNIELEMVGKSHVGNGKYQKSIKLNNHSRQDEDIYNEDVFFYDQYENIKILAVGDGVSTAMYGSGKRAGELLKKNIKESWTLYKCKMQERSHIESFVEDICRNTVEDIIREIGEEVVIATDVESVNGIMATTLVIALIINNKMYYCSIGDSFILLFNEKYGLSIISKEENVGNEMIEKGVSWDIVCNTYDKDYITNYIGKVAIKNKKLVGVIPKILVKELFLDKDDTIILCSDGILDYIERPEYSNNLWNRDKIFENILTNSSNLKEMAEKIIDEANKNGGGDNLTIILAKAK